MTKRQGTLWIGLLTGALLAGPLVLAQQPFDVNVPSGAVAHFDRTTAAGCPVGWTELTAARGYYLTGLVSGGTRGVAVGTALADQEGRTHTHTIAHTHALGPHTHSVAGTTNGPSALVGRDRDDTLTDASPNDHTHTYSTTSSSETATSGAASVANSSTQTGAQVLPYLAYLICKRS